ncbi:MAG: hypothetical protein R3324_11605 [Halobacteriales archaeon]|nr:hypothetical protein [Halobacteriales archaeon]
MQRRRFLQTASVATGMSLVGCLGANQGGGDGWPPARNLVDVISPDPTSTIGQANVNTAAFWEQYFEEDITVATSNHQGQQELNTYNLLGSEEVARDGSVLMCERVNPIIISQMGREEANYDVREFDSFYQILGDTRAMLVNHRTLPAEDHFDLTWGEFRDYAEDEGPIVGGWGNAIHKMIMEALRQWDPVLNEDNFRLVRVDSGGELRTGMQRGDIDLHNGSFPTNFIGRNEFYYTQWVYVDPGRQPALWESIKDVQPETAPTSSPEQKTLANNPDYAFVESGYPRADARRLIDLISDFIFYMAPPNTNAEAMEAFNASLDKLVEDGEYTGKMRNLFSAAFAPIVGEDIHQKVLDKFATFNDDEKARTLIEEELF